MLLFLALICTIAWLSYPRSPSPMSTTTSDLAGWYARATPTDAFEPTRDALALAVLHSTPAAPDGLTLALFAPDRAIDAHGRTLRLPAADFAALVALAQRTLALPRPFQWRVAARASSAPIDNVAVGPAGVHYGVYNGNTGATELAPAVGGRTHLPEEIAELLARAREAAPAGWPRAVPELAHRVRALIDDPR